MDQMLSGNQDLEVDIEAGLTYGTQESTSDSVLCNEVWSEQRVHLDVSEKLPDDLINPLMGEENRVESDSARLDISEKKCDKKSQRKASKPPRHPKGPSLSANDHKFMKEIAELAMRKRKRIERMRNSLKRMNAAKSSSSSSCSSIFSMIVTVLFFVFFIFQGFCCNSSLGSDKSLAPVVSPTNQMISVRFYNEFAPVQQIDPSPTTSFRYTRKRITGAEEEEKSRDVTR